MPSLFWREIRNHRKKKENNNNIKILLNVVGAYKSDYLKIEGENNVKLLDEEKNWLYFNYHHVFIDENPILKKFTEKNDVLNEGYCTIFYGPKRFFNTFIQNFICFLDTNKKKIAFRIIEDFIRKNHSKYNENIRWEVSLNQLSVIDLY